LTAGLGRFLDGLARNVMNFTSTISTIDETPGIT
jgi:hypothetical protein